MKFLIIFAALASVALAEFHFFVEDREIVNEITKKIDFKHIAIRKGDHREVIIRSPKNIIEDQIIAFLESNREKIPDPFSYERLSLRLNQPLIFRLDVNIENMLIAGLQKFVIENVSFNLISMRFSFEIVIPEITYDSDFDVDGRVVIIYPFDMTGVSKVKIDNFAIGAQTRLGVTADGFMSLREFSLNLNVEKLSLLLSGIEGNGPIEVLDWLNERITEDLVHEVFAVVSESLSDSLFDAFNDILGTIKYADLIG